jgi:Anti-sigma factor NepR
MKTRKTSAETVEQDTDRVERVETHDSMRRPHKEIRLGREAQARIGELLRTMYNSYVNQGVPAQLEELVRRLGEGEQD